MVLHCSAEADQRWLNNTMWQGRTIYWGVCCFHHWRLDAGDPSAMVHAQPPSWHRWILMGSDLQPAIQAAAVAMPAHRSLAG